MKFILLLLIITLSFLSNAQFNVDSMSNIRYISTHATLVNDVWGYTDEFGNEYGIIGAEKGVAIVDVTNPSVPNEIWWENTTQSIWRDVKTYGDYAYVTTEANVGLMIIDLTSLPATIIPPATYYTGPAGNPWSSAHNIYIDDNGFAYIFGADRGNNGVIILDVATDPLNPIEVGVFDNWLVHDGFVRNDTMFLAHIFEGTISMVDVINKAAPVLLGTQFTPGNFAHNIWANSTGQYAFATDEIVGGFVSAFDISDPSNIVEIDKIKSSPDVGTIIPHNTHVKGNHLITSYYSDGVVIHDVTYPYNMIEVGNYDTYPTQTPNYDGCWGVYPFFASGTILANDRSEGLFVLSPTYIQASYLEGIVTDAITTIPLLNVDVSIVSGIQNESTSAIGFYATGSAIPGTYDVTYSKVGYFPQTITVSIATGIITTQDVQLTPIPPYNLTVTVLELGTSNVITGAEIILEVPEIAHQGVTNGAGEDAFTLFYQDNYRVTVGKWGYNTACYTQLIDNTTGNITVYLKPGYYDDFSFDFGWAVSGSATTGIWERGVPLGTTSGSAPSMDDSSDCGEMAFVTGNSTNLHPDADDVDAGTTNLNSPIMDLTTYVDPYVNYSRWFYNEFGANAIDDTLRVLVNNGSITVEIDKVGKDPSTWDQWVEKSIRLQDFITITSTMQFYFRTSDLDPDINITEAGVDYFYIANAAELGLEELEISYIAYPNPTSSSISIIGIDALTDYVLYDLKGTVILKGEISSSQNLIDLTPFQNGMYFLDIQNKTTKVIKE
ncbi:MAG: choice-of-anchor B family protein [Fluviicola sp.]|nr:choice-of-anchor B family protein [Fluviicola sp.]